jgi:mRNA interferase MazF
MGKFVKGEVVVVPFPFSNLTNSTKRPALVVAELLGDDVILCQITTGNRPDGYSIPLSKSDFATGSIHLDSSIRPSRLFTADSNIIIKSIGKLSVTKMAEVEEKIIEILTS